jgi:hypothetical protein
MTQNYYEWLRGGRKEVVAGYRGMHLIWMSKTSRNMLILTYIIAANMVPFAICSSWFWWFMLTQVMGLTTLSNISL